VFSNSAKAGTGAIAERITAAPIRIPQQDRLALIAALSPQHGANIAWRLLLIQPNCDALVNDTIKCHGWSGRYEGSKYQKQRQAAEHDGLLNTAGIEFA